MIEISNISSGYEGKRVLRNFSVTFEKSAFCAVMGPNGSGKSTLLRSIAGLQLLEEGDIRIDGLSLSQYKPLELARKIAFVPQREDVVFDFSVFEVVMMGRNPYQNRWEFSTPEDEKLVERVLEMTNLKHLKDRMLGQLSGGELRRAMIARAIAQQTPIIMLDEPLANLDVVHQFEIMDILAELNQRQQATIIIVLHDFPYALQYAQEVLLMKEGEIQHFGPTSEVLTPENVQNCFGLGSRYEYSSDGIVRKRG